MCVEQPQSLQKGGGGVGRVGNRAKKNNRKWRRCGLKLNPHLMKSFRRKLFILVHGLLDFLGRFWTALLWSLWPASICRQVSRVSVLNYPLLPSLYDLLQFAGRFLQFEFWTILFYQVYNLLQFAGRFQEFEIWLFFVLSNLWSASICRCFKNQRMWCVKKWWCRCSWPMWWVFWDDRYHTLLLLLITRLIQ